MHQTVSTRRVWHKFRFKIAARKRSENSSSYYSKKTLPLSFRGLNRVAEIVINRPIPGHVNNRNDIQNERTRREHARGSSWQGSRRMFDTNFNRVASNGQGIIQQPEKKKKRKIIIVCVELSITKREMKMKNGKGRGTETDRWKNGQKWGGKKGPPMNGISRRGKLWFAGPAGSYKRKTTANTTRELPLHRYSFVSRCRCVRTKNRNLFGSRYLLHRCALYAPEILP